MKKPIADPQYDFIPGFLSATEADECQRYLESLGGLNLETGDCTHPPTHTTIQFGPRQSYLACVPEQFRTVSSGPITPYLAAIQARLEERYDCTFNSIQINKHFNQDAKVDSHIDSPPGHIAMLSVGAVRDFTLQHVFYKPLATIPLYHGSLLTFYPRDQYRMRHMMLRSKTPSGVCFHIVFRYIPHILTQVMMKDLPKDEKKKVAAERDREYNEAQIAGRISRGTL